jgi:catechol 2,3-dioxygenase-like lactoylglutathione lyase family enzyme
MEERGLLGWPTWIGVVVEDLDRQRRFWGDLLGLPEAASGPGFVHWDLGGGRSFELIQRSNDPEYDRARFQVGFAVDDIHRARDELIHRGVEPITGIIGGDESSWAYFRDAEGNVFEITQR